MAGLVDAIGVGQIHERGLQDVAQHGGNPGWLTLSGDALVEAGKKMHKEHHERYDNYPDHGDVNMMLATGDFMRAVRLLKEATNDPQ